MANANNVAPSREVWLGSPAAVVEQAMIGDPHGPWTTSVRGMWCVARPAGRRLRGQGWKLHLSATPNSVLDLLAVALPVLVAERCAFKVAATLDAVRWLNSAKCPRGTGGKCVTVYPNDDEQFARLAALLDR